MNPALATLPVEFGNAGDADTHGTGWIIGFSEWAKSGEFDLRHMPFETESTGLCVKWFSHEAGHPNGEDKPVSEGRTMSMLIGAASEFRIDFSHSSAFEPERTRTHILRRPGDFAIWGGGIYHRAFGLKAANVLTIRWIPR